MRIVQTLGWVIMTILGVLLALPAFGLFFTILICFEQPLMHGLSYKWPGWAMLAGSVGVGWFAGPIWGLLSLVAMLAAVGFTFLAILCYASAKCDEARKQEEEPLYLAA